MGQTWVPVDQRIQKYGCTHMIKLMDSISWF